MTNGRWSLLQSAKLSGGLQQEEVVRKFLKTSMMQKFPS